MSKRLMMQEIRAAKKSAQARLRRFTAESIIERAGADMYAVRQHLDRAQGQSANQMAIAAVLSYEGIKFSQHVPAFPAYGGRPFVIPFVTYDYEGKRDAAILLHSDRWDKGADMEARRVRAIADRFPGIKIITLEDEELRNDPHTAFLRLGFDLAVDTPLPFEIEKPAMCYGCGKYDGLHPYDAEYEGLHPLKWWADFYDAEIPTYDGPDHSVPSTVRMYCADCAFQTITQYRKDKKTLIACGALIALYEARDILKSAGYVVREDALNRLYDACKSGTLEVRSKAEMCVALMLDVYGVPYNFQQEVDCPQASGAMQRYRVDFLLPGNKWLEIQGAQMHKESDVAAEQKRTSDILKVHPEWHRIPDLTAEEIAGGTLMGREVQPAVWKVTDMLIREGLIKQAV